MKRGISLMMVFLFLTGILYSQSLKLTSPNGGEKWPLGNRHKITWNATKITTNVKLLLSQNGNNIGTIVQNIPVSRKSYSWKVGKYQGGTASAGGGYVIRIMTMDGKFIDKSDDSFTILQSPEASRLPIRPIKPMPQTLPLEEPDHGDVEVSPRVVTIRYGQNVITIGWGETAHIEVDEYCDEDWWDWGNWAVHATLEYRLKNKKTENFKFEIYLTHGDRTLASSEVLLFGSQTKDMQHEVTIKPSNDPLYFGIWGPVGSGSNDTPILFFSGYLWVQFIPM